MANRFDIITQQLFQKNISECSVEELENLANDYPYFAPAQYALLQKLKETDGSAYQEQLQKAILYHHDPFVFDQFINGNGLDTDYVITETAKQDEAPLLSDSEVEPVEEVSMTEEVPFEKPEFEEPVTVEEKEELGEEINVVTEEETNAIEEEETAVNTEQEIVASAENITTIEQQEEIALSPVDESKYEPIEQKTEQPIEEVKQTNNVTAELSFEPYHTVDYFASQGIKLSQEEVPKDRFGKQLKSFTEWLKTMRRLPVSDQIKSLDKTPGTLEKDVENLAAHSVEGADVYTEAMAEVWLRQGNKEKAIEIYNKLSLLNPSKRAYFATKIDSLK